MIKRFGDGRSSIQITGLREGEKLYEELLTAEDNSIPTEYKKIFKAIVENGIKRKVIEDFVADIFVKGNDELTKTLCGFVPCFKQERN